MTTTEGNKLIAEFMNRQNPYSNFAIISRDRKGANVSMNKNPSDYAKYGEMKFHSSWDWLMPVVEKVYEHANIGDGLRTDTEESLMGIIDIDNTYRCVVDYIDHYNKNK
ncbi:hypothetical protein [uncultured Mediterranean phage]|nr:hypothetical protein [uncultured Mediterranean phage]